MSGILGKEDGLQGDGGKYRCEEGYVWVKSRVLKLVGVGKRGLLGEVCWLCCNLPSYGLEYIYMNVWWHNPLKVQKYILRACLRIRCLFLTERG